MSKVGNALMLIFLILISLICLFPFYLMIVMGTYESNQLYTGIKLWFGDYLANNWNSLFTKINFLAYYRNSLVVAISTTLLGLLVCSMVGYALGKYQFRLRNFLFGVVLAMLMIPVQFSVVAFVVEMRWLGWMNTHWPLIIPPAANAFGAFWMTQFAKSSIPTEVLESARIDGCSEYGIFFRIALPFMRSALVTLALLLFLWSWNNFFMPLVILSDNNLYTIPLGIRGLAGQFRNDFAAQILGLTLGTIPVLIFFSIFSKNLIQGLTAAAIKG